jgi:hypothetical protein
LQIAATGVIQANFDLIGQEPQSARAVVIRALLERPSEKRGDPKCNLFLAVFEVCRYQHA